MTNEQKKQVRDALVRYVQKFETQTRAAESLEGVGISTISQVKHNNWELISDRLWHNIARQVGFYCGEWQPADTSAHLLLRILFSDAQHYAMTYGIAIGEGLGKTFTATRYVRENDHTYYLAGNKEHNRRTFITALLHAAGIAAKGTMPEMIQAFTDHIGNREESLVIVDDAEKLKDRVLHLLVFLVNSLSGNSGMVMLGGDQLRTRIIEGVRMKKTGFEEIYKSIWQRFITLGYPGPKDVELVCRANGVYDEAIINHIKEESKGNLHAATLLIQEANGMRRAA